MSAHTPGPWRIDYATRGWEICTIHGTPPDENGQTWCYIQPSTYYYGDADEDAANARLIAAAPDLISVTKDFRRKLETYASIYPGDKELSRLLGDCDAAIAKAEGRT